MKDLIHSVAASAKALGFLDETAYRNLCYKMEYEERINSGENSEEIILTISERVHLSVSQIEKIVHPRGEKKEQTEKVLVQVLQVKKQTRRVHYNRRRR